MNIYIHKKIFSMGPWEDESDLTCDHYGTQWLEMFSRQTVRESVSVRVPLLDNPLASGSVHLGTFGT